MEIKTVKVITISTYLDRILSETVVGVFESDKVQEALDKLKKEQIEAGYKFISEKKDCCDWTMVFENEEEIESDKSVIITTKGFILNELVE